jgi:predicted amidohydrolase
MLARAKWTIPLLMSIDLASAPGGNTDRINKQPTGLVKVAAVQIKGYDKGDLPREGYDASNAILPYIDRAGKDGAQLVVFPEYVLGHIRVPGPTTERISAAAAANHVYVIVGGWEDYADGTFSDVALIFDRGGKIAGKYRKTHAAVDHYEGEPPWSKPPTGKDRSWFLENDPEWLMKRGDDFPVFTLDFGKVGIEICYDGWFPEPARILSLKGAELIVWINGRQMLVEDYIVKSVMFQSQVAMVSTNQSYGGGTMIGDLATWQPQIIASAPDKKEAYISANIDLNKIRELRASSRNFQQRRPDLYRDLVGPIKSKY